MISLQRNDTDWLWMSRMESQRQHADNFLAILDMLRTKPSVWQIDSLEKKTILLSKEHYFKGLERFFFAPLNDCMPFHGKSMRTLTSASRGHNRNVRSCSEHEQRRNWQICAEIWNYIVHDSRSPWARTLKPRLIPDIRGYGVHGPVTLAVHCFEVSPFSF